MRSLDVTGASTQDTALDCVATFVVASCGCNPGQAVCGHSRSEYGPGSKVLLNIRMTPPGEHVACAQFLHGVLRLHVLVACQSCALSYIRLRVHDRYKATKTTAVRRTCRNACAADVKRSPPAHPHLRRLLLSGSMSVILGSPPVVVCGPALSYVAKAAIGYVSDFYESTRT